MEKTMESTGKPVTRIILTGPESTGKSQLSAGLASHFSKNFIPEYARDYVSNLHRAYSYDDVMHIAKRQIELMNEFSEKSNSLLFVDTYLIITKVWFIRVFGTYPVWIDEEIQQTKNDFYLLCKTDIPWIPDGVRENGGAMREILFNDYLDELNNRNLNFAIVDGNWENRLSNAIIKVNEFLLQRGLK
jgi:NadR type nicotinamide-nucleotide adenylyltransferase